jgi:hypothetical protein
MLILTPVTAKGLEFEVVILYKLLENPQFKQINKRLADFELTEKSHLGYPKLPDIPFELIPYLNKFFTFC